MCGIAGAYWKGTRPAQAAAIVDRMVSAISHRGPDSDGRSSCQFAEVGFKRLSIIDLATGDQPLFNEDGSIECFLNGEIYNYQELRADLVKRGHIFKTSSDTEVIPHLYEDLGERMFAKLNGMFSICIIDHRQQMLLLARDHFGVKQMYYAETERAVVFGSEMKAVLSSGLVEQEMDEASILAYMTLFYSPEPNTLVKGVKKLPAGTFLKFCPAKSATLVRYYEIPRAPQISRISTGEATERITQLLEKSIGLQLHADVPVGISLSGGLDSSVIASLACVSQNAPSTLMALTISWPDTDPDELACSRELCQRLGLHQEIIQPEPGNFESDLPLLAWISDEPIADPATYSQFRVAQAAGERVRVLLGGAGGDELFGGYGSYVLPRKKQIFAGLPGWVQRASHKIVASRWMDDESASALMDYKQSRFHWHCHNSRNISESGESALRQALPDSYLTFRNWDRLFRDFAKYDAVNQQMLVDLESYLPEQVLPMMDRATMAASIEGRVPFLDVPLVEFCFSLSGDLKLGRPAAQKRLLKSAVEKLVPPQVLRKKKSGMPSHFGTFLSQHPEVIKQLLLRKDSYVARVLPKVWLQGMVRSVESMRRNSSVLYTLVVLEIWRQLFLVEKQYNKPSVTLSDLFRLPSKLVSAHS